MQRKCRIGFGLLVVVGWCGTTFGGPARQNEDDANWLDMGKAIAQGSAPSAAPTGAPTAAAKPEMSPADDTTRLVPWVDYTGDLWHRAALTGDWGGLRQRMMDKGLRINVNLTQTYQGNIGGGVKKQALYQGGLRYELDLDTGAAGLWPGGQFHVRGETSFGKSDNSNSASLMPVNTDALYPVPGKDLTCLSEAYYMQFVSSWLGFIGGKMSPREANVFAHDETTQFMNNAFVYNPVQGASVPLDFLAAGVILLPTDWLKISTFVLDSEGSADQTGFETVFERGTTIYQNSEVTVKPFDQVGHQRVSWTWTDKSSVKLRQDPRLILRGLVQERLGLGAGPTLNRQGSDWCFMYDFDQYLYTKPGTKDQGFGLFGRFGFSDGEVNPVAQFYSVGLGGKGMIPQRDKDTFGVGFYYLGVSDKLGPLLDRRIGDEQGVEMFYNIEITPWLHITPDIQVINPGRIKYDETAVVTGVRMRIDF